MNWLLFIQLCFSGLFAGFFAWLVAPGGNPWDLIDNFQTGLLVTGVFSGVFTGLVIALPVQIMEKRRSKAFAHMISASSVGLSIPMLGAVIFSIFAGILTSSVSVPSGVLRFFWWLCLSLCLSGCFGLLYRSLKIMCRSLMGLTPAFIIAGAFLDRYFLIQQYYLLSFLFIGGLAGFGLALSWELLKESWLDEDAGWRVVFRYYIDGPEFVAGSADECDLTFPDGPGSLFVIYEKDGLHVVETLEDELTLKVNNCRFRYRALVDGDTITAGNRVFVYHTRLSRTRDAMPEAAA